MNYKSVSLVLFLALAGCDLSPYRITIHDIFIESIEENGGRGRISVDREDEIAMESSGDIYVDGRLCEEDSCFVSSIGSIEKAHTRQIGNISSLEVNFHYDFLENGPRNIGHNWLNKVICIRLVAQNGILGRFGQSEWNCNIRKLW